METANEQDEEEANNRRLLETVDGEKEFSMKTLMKMSAEMDRCRRAKAAKFSQTPDPRNRKEVLIQEGIEPNPGPKRKTAAQKHNWSRSTRWLCMFIHFVNPYHADAFKMEERCTSQEAKSMNYRSSTERMNVQRGKLLSETCAIRETNGKSFMNFHFISEHNQSVQQSLPMSTLSATQLGHTGKRMDVQQGELLSEPCVIEDTRRNQTCIDFWMLTMCLTVSAAWFTKSRTNKGKTERRTPQQPERAQRKSNLSQHTGAGEGSPGDRICSSADCKGFSKQ